MRPERIQDRTGVAQQVLASVNRLNQVLDWLEMAVQIARQLTGLRSNTGDQEAQ